MSNGEYRWARIHSYEDQPGMQYFARAWGGDQFGLAELVMKRRSLRFTLRTLGMLGCIAAALVALLYYKLPLIPNAHLLYLVVVIFGLAWWLMVPIYTERGLDEANKYESFANAVYAFCRAFDVDVYEASTTSAEDLASRVKAKMVATALDVRKLERDSAGIPQEHWEEQKRVFTSTLESCYNAAKPFDLASGGYGPYYKQADEQLALAA